MDPAALARRAFPAPLARGLGELRQRVDLAAERAGPAGAAFGRRKRHEEERIGHQAVAARLRGRPLSRRGGAGKRADDACGPRARVRGLARSPITRSRIPRLWPPKTDIRRCQRNRPGSRRKSAGAPSPSAESVLGHSGNEHRVADPDRRFDAVQRHDALAGDDVIDLGRGVAVKAKPTARVELGDAAGDAVGRRAALREQGPPADAPPDRIVPAVERRLRLVKYERPHVSCRVRHSKMLPDSAGRIGPYSAPRASFTTSAVSLPPEKSSCSIRSPRRAMRALTAPSPERSSCAWRKWVSSFVARSTSRRTSSTSRPTSV